MTSSSSDLDTLLENKKSYYLEALLCIHQVEAIEEGRRKTQRALQKLEQSPEGGLPDSLHETAPSNNMLHMSDDDMVDVPPTPRLTRTSLADDLTDQEDDENASLHQQQSDEESISHSLQQDPVSPLSFLHDSNSSSISNSHRNVSRGQHPTRAKKQRPSDLEEMSHADLQEEVLRLRETVQTCQRSMLAIQENADTKIQKLELQVLFLERKLADEEAITSKLSVSNQSLRRELQAAFVEAKDSQDSRKCRKMVNLHQRELTTEKHLNSLLVARNQAVKQNTQLKRMLLQTCQDCRNRLPLKKAKQPQPPQRSTSVDSVSTPPASMSTLDASNGSLMTPRVMPETDSRPTWQSSKQSVLDQMALQVANQSNAFLPEHSAAESPPPSPRHGPALPRSASSNSQIGQPLPFEKGGSLRRQTSGSLPPRSPTTSGNLSTSSFNTTGTPTGRKVYAPPVPTADAMDSKQSNRRLPQQAEPPPPSSDVPPDHSLPSAPPTVPMTPSPPSTPDKKRSGWMQRLRGKA